MSEDKIFADGFVFKRNENAPEFVIGRMSIKIEDALAFMREHDKGGWINLNVKQARSGNYYVELDNYEPKKSNSNNGPSQQETTDGPAKKEPDTDDDLPF